MDFDSREELYFKWYLDELKAYEIISRYKYHPNPFPLSSDLTYQVLNRNNKRFSKVSQSTLLHKHEYKADFIIYWTPKLKEIIWQPIYDKQYINLKKIPFVANYSESAKEYYSVVDVKGTFQGPHNNSAITFVLNQKWVWMRYRIYIQKTVTHPRITKTGKHIPTNALFSTTFIPERFLLTDKDFTKRMIHYPIRSIDQYLIDSLKLNI